MEQIKKEFVIEFNLLGKHVRTILYAQNKEDALDELFKSLRTQTHIYFIAEPDNEFNKIMSEGKTLLDSLDKGAKAPLQ